MKKKNDNSTNRNKTRIWGRKNSGSSGDTHIWGRGKSGKKDSETYYKQGLDEDTEQDLDVDLQELGEDGIDDTMHFDFDESDVERFRRKSMEENPTRSGRTRGRKGKNGSGDVFRKENLDTTMNLDEDASGYGTGQRQDMGGQGAYGSGQDASAGKRRAGSRRKSKSPKPGAGDTVILGMVNKKQTNKEIRRLSYFMVALMLGVISYMVYFNIAGSRNVVNDSRNALMTKVAEKVIRGKILSADGEVLAESVQASDGSYYRNYPYENVFAHVVGTSSVNKSGIEQSADYDLITSSINPLTKIFNDIREEKNPGNNVITTLDSSLQQKAYDLLGDNDGVVVAIEPKTGKVLAMVSKPDYNPNTLSENYDSYINDSDSKVLLNQATNGLFVPGSIFKICTTLAYVRSGFDPDDYSFTCDGSITLQSDDGEQSISCYGGEVHGEQTLKQSFANSCNSSYANIGQTISVEEMVSVCNSLLFNTDLPSAFSTTQSVFSLDSSATSWTIGATAIGQGSTQMTPLHACMLASAIANDGNLMEPYVIDEVQNADGTTVRKTSQTSYGQLMSASEAELLQNMMEDVVSEGTAYKLAGKSYSCAGKTGTAEVSGQGNNAWFIGYAPADDPQIAVCVLVEDTGTASSVAVPIAGELFDEYLNE